MGERPGGVSELTSLAEVRQARMAGIIWDEGFARVTDLRDVTVVTKRPLQRERPARALRSTSTAHSAT